MRAFFEGMVFDILPDYEKLNKHNTQQDIAQIWLTVGNDRRRARVFKAAGGWEIALISDNSEIDDLSNSSPRDFIRQEMAAYGMESDTLEEEWEAFVKFYAPVFA